MSHADQVSTLPKNFKVIASSTNYFEVLVRDEEGRPVSDAIVTLYKSDEHSITSSSDSRTSVTRTAAQIHDLRPPFFLIQSSLNRGPGGFGLPSRLWAPSSCDQLGPEA